MRNAMVRVALFFNGQNFHVGWKEAAGGRRVDFTQLAQWIVQRAGGAQLVGAHYFVSIQENSSKDLDQSQQEFFDFLGMIDVLPGFFVHAFEGKVKRVNCEKCGLKCFCFTDKETDLAVVSHMLRLASVNAYDIAVLLSGDESYVPALQALKAMGKQVHVAGWGSGNISKRMRVHSFSQIDMLEGLKMFEPNSSNTEKCSAEKSADQEPLEIIGFTGNNVLDAFISEVMRAEKKFAGGYVGLTYFLNRWQSKHLEDDCNARRSLLNHLLVENWVETYDARPGKIALRLSDRAREYERENSAK